MVKSCKSAQPIAGASFQNFECDANKFTNKANNDL